MKQPSQREQELVQEAGKLVAELAEWKRVSGCETPAEADAAIQKHQAELGEVKTMVSEIRRLTRDDRRSSGPSCVIVGEQQLEDLLWRYDGVGEKLSSTERELLLFALRNESQARGGIVATASKSLSVYVAATCKHVWDFRWCGGSPSEPQEAVKVCMKCGTEDTGD